MEGAGEGEHGSQGVDQATSFLLTERVKGQASRTRGGPTSCVE
jgi:hypothetical protein